MSRTRPAMQEKKKDHVLAKACSMILQFDLVDKLSSDATWAGYNHTMIKIF